MKLLNVDGKHIDPFEHLLEIERVECESSLYTFVQKAWRYVDPSPFVHGWPLEAMCEHLEAVVDGDIRKLLINIPPRCGKSSIVSVCFPAWVWTQRENTATSGPQVPLLHASYAMSLAMRDSVKCRRLIESPWYQSLWGERFHLVGDQNTKGRFTNDQGGERLITSIGGVATGEGGNIIVIDDPTKPNEALSRTESDKLRFWFENTLKMDPSRAIAYLNLGDAYARSGQADKARAAFKTYLELAPNGPGVNYVKQALQKL